MAITPKPTGTENIWASAGLSIDPTSVKINQGWVVETPPYQFENFQRKKEGEFIQHVNQRGVPEWDAVTEYGIGSLTIASDNQLYQSMTTGNSGNDPIAAPTHWVVAAGSGALRSPQENIIIGGNFGTNPFQRDPTSGLKTVIWGNILTESITHTSADRFGTFQNTTAPITGIVTMEKWANTPTVLEAGILSESSLKYEVSTAQPAILAGNSLACTYIIEGFDFQKIAQQPFILSFWVYASVAGTYAVEFSNASPADKFLTTVYTVDAANTWQKIELAIAETPAAGNWKYDNDKGLVIGFSLIAGSNSTGTNFDTWETTNNLPAGHVNFLSNVGNIFAINLVKVEPGAIASGWVEPLFPDVLARSQRYLQKSYRLSVSPGSLTGTNEILGNLGSSGLVPSFATVVAMRDSNISGTVYSPITGLKNAARNFTTSLDVAVPESLTNAETNRIDFEVSAGASTGDAILYHYVLDAEFKN